MRIMELKDNNRIRLLQLDETQMAELAQFLKNLYPIIEMNFEVADKDGLESGQMNRTH